MAVTPNSIVTPQAPRSGTAVCTNANTTYSDAPANAVKLATAGPNGARVTRVSAIPRGTVTPTQLQLYRSADGGTTKRLFRSALMAAHSMSATAETPIVDFGYADENPLLLGPGEELWCAAGVAAAAGICFTAEWGDY